MRVQKEAQRNARRFQKSKQFPKRPAVLNDDIALDEKQPLSSLEERRDTARQSAAPAGPGTPTESHVVRAALSFQLGNIPTFNTPASRIRHQPI